MRSRGALTVISSLTSLVSKTGSGCGVAGNLPRCLFFSGEEKATSSSLPFSAFESIYVSCCHRHQHHVPVHPNQDDEVHSVLLLLQDEYRSVAYMPHTT